MKTYAAYYQNEVRKYSSSGGLFSLLASQFDVVYGVEMDKSNKYAIYTRKVTDIAPLRGSKYIQAKVGDTFKLVKQDLLNGKKVLFTGTACQVNGLLAFLQIEYMNLVTIDIVCHGVPTPKYWHKFIENKDIYNINFRAKDRGWNNYTYGMQLNDVYIPHNQNKYMELYVRNYPLRPSCYECVFKTDKRSDITLGDFWGIEKLDSSMTDNKGTSLVIVRTIKGEKIFDSIKDYLMWKEMTYENGIKQNPSEYSSSVKPENRAEFFEDMESMSFDELYNKYCHKVKHMSRLIDKIKSIIKKVRFIK